MKVSTLLNLHFENCDVDAVLNNFGDAYLLKHNRIFKAIRRQTLKLGFVFIDATLTPDYLVFPMGQLETLLGTKKIPYLNNVEPLKKAGYSVKSDLDWDHIVDNLKPNYIFHESCHAVARSVAPQFDDLQLSVTVTLIEESFANTCEFLAICDAENTSHRLFLEMNSYFTIFEDRTNLKNIIEKIGTAKIFRFMLICYLYSNFLNERFNDTDFKRILRISELLSFNETKTLKSLAQNVFLLNPRFRFATTEMYLKQKGLNADVQKALNFDFLSLIETDRKLIQFLSDLTATLSF